MGATRSCLMEKMMGEEIQASWNNALDLLLQWHIERSQDVGRSVFGFIESELRLMIPVVVRRFWPSDLMEDALQDFLARLIKHPLDGDITNLRAYLRRAFANHCIDRYRARERKLDTSCEAGAGEWMYSEEESTHHAVLLNERRVWIHSALARLSPADRVVLKLEFAPEWLDDDEVVWLAKNTDSNPQEVREAINTAEDMYALSKVFDPGSDNPDEPEARRLRMERFRRRRARARDKLRGLLQEDGV